MIHIHSSDAMQEFGERVGAKLHGGEVLELVGDVGAGKTTFVRGLARGMGVDEVVQSPSFTISRVYDASDDRRLIHYDFYRLDDAGIMRDELADAMKDPLAVIVIEWAEAVESVLPHDRLVLKITSTGDEQRDVSLEAHGASSQLLAGAIA